MIHQLTHIGKAAALFALDNALSKNCYKIMCYVDSMDKPDDRSDAVAYSIVKVGGHHEYVRMDNYEWRMATPEEEKSDIDLAKSLINQCDQFELKHHYNPFGEECFILIAYNSDIHKTVHDYALHIEHISIEDANFIMSMDEADDIANSLPVDETPKVSKRVRL